MTMQFVCGTTCVFEWVEGAWALSNAPCKQQWGWRCGYYALDHIRRGGARSLLGVFQFRLHNGRDVGAVHFACLSLCLTSTVPTEREPHIISMQSFLPSHHL